MHKYNWFGPFGVAHTYMSLEPTTWDWISNRGLIPGEDKLCCSQQSLTARGLQSRTGDSIYGVMLTSSSNTQALFRLWLM